jgi:surface antigen
VIFFGAPVVLWNREVWGSVIGGAAGGLLGSAVGRGAGNTAAIIGGTVLGTLVGGSVGHSMDDLDRLRVAQALENVPSRQALAWQNPDTENRYEVEPLGTFKGQDGRYCREFQAKALIAGESQQIYGTACRQPDGSWEIVR